MRSVRTWKIGDVKITRVQEYEGSGISWIVPEAIPENLAKIDWIGPFVGDDGKGRVAIQSLVIEDGDQRIVVDTCVGNDKQRSIPFWNMLQGSFLDDMAGAGFPPESIDTVVCTHLHSDHVGWNTKLVDGAWVPTFPNARYLLGADGVGARLERSGSRHDHRAGRLGTADLRCRSRRPRRCPATHGRHRAGADTGPHTGAHVGVGHLAR